MPLPTYDELVKSDLPSYEELTGGSGKSLPSYDELVSEPADKPAWVPAELQQADEQQAMERQAGATATLGDVKDVFSQAAKLPVKGALIASGAGALRWPTDKELETPVVSPEAMKTVMPYSYAADAAAKAFPQNPVAQVAQGTTDALTSVASGLTSPENAAMLGVAPESAIGQRLVAGTFLGQSMMGLPEQWDALEKAPTVREKAKIAGEMIIGTALPALGLKGHAKASTKPKAQSLTGAEFDALMQEWGLGDEQAKAGEVPKDDSAGTAKEVQSLPANSPVSDQTGPAQIPPDTAPSLPVSQLPSDNPAVARFRPEPQPEVTASPVEQSTTEKRLNEVLTSKGRITEEQIPSDGKEAQPESVDVSGQNAPDPTRVTSFQTSKGSIYEVHEDGTTTRNKSPHPEHPGDEGLKPRSAATFYVTPEQAVTLSEVQARGGGKRTLAQLPDGSWAVKYLDGPSAGKFEKRTVTKPFVEPAGGLMPVEVWSDGTTHFGNEITGVKYGNAPSVPSPSEKQSAAPGSPKSEFENTGEPTSTNRVERVSDDPFVSRIANRFTEERAKSGEIGEVAPGEGYATSDLVRRGLRMSPEEVSQHVSDIMNDAGGDPVKQAAAIRAEEARLSDRSTELSRAAESNPTNLQARQAANAAFQDLTDFHNGPVAKLKTRFHATGMALQGEIPVDLSTFNGLREAWLKETGKAPPANMEGTFRRTAENVRRGVAEERETTNRLGQEIEKATANRRLPSAEEIRNAMREEMGLGPCRI